MTWHIHGHDWAVKLLRSHAGGDKLRHAYLLVGPQGVGRRSLALRFAQALNCTASDTPGEPCGECRECRQIWAMAHPDMSLLGPDEGHKDIRIDQVRALQHTLALSPYTAKYRIALLPNFQQATESASNALLKTLEEPPDKVVLLLTADTLESLLPTIVSRCEVIRLRPDSIADAEAYLQSEKSVDAELAHLLTHLSGGRIGAAIRLAEEPESLNIRRETLETLLEMLSATRVDRFRLAEELSKPYDKAREKAGAAIPTWLSFWRDVFVNASGADLPLVNVDFRDQVDRVSAALDLASARALVLRHEEALAQLDAYGNVRLVLEDLMLHWPHL
ncbi:MAG: DNA polymerase III subunit delta' [Anaerolineaceae bacterium]|nr:DNA polymerase III subunit delta' [Anaerolineaceae bacterium]